MSDDSTSTAPVVILDDDDAIRERLVTTGDLRALTPKQRTRYYMLLCERYGLDWSSQPFAYLTLSGKLVLYATKNATEQLRKIHKVSIVRLERDGNEDTYTVTAYGRLPDGREDVATGVVGIHNFHGEALANAMMKAETKAKRRLTLSIIGLGMLDESEVEGNILGGRVEVDPHTGEITRDVEDALADSEPPDPPVPPDFADIAKDELLLSVKTGLSQVKWDRARQEGAWKAFCGDATFLTAEATTAQLNELREHLVANWREANPKGKR